jgi:hypothetical protein
MHARVHGAASMWDSCDDQASFRAVSPIAASLCAASQQFSTGSRLVYWQIRWDELVLAMCDYGAEL